MVDAARESGHYAPIYEEPQTDVEMGTCGGSDFCLGSAGKDDPRAFAEKCARDALAILTDTGEVSTCPRMVTAADIRQDQEHVEALEDAMGERRA